MKTKLHTLFIYPLVLIFSSFLKGKKNEYKNFFINKPNNNNQENILEVTSKENEFFEQIKYFFDKTSPVYDKTFIEFEIDTKKEPEEKKYFAFDFLRVLKIFYTLSMLSAKIPNENINIGFTIKDKKLNENETNHFLRYALLAFASQRIDSLCFEIDINYIIIFQLFQLLSDFYLLIRIYLFLSKTSIVEVKNISPYNIKLIN